VSRLARDLDDGPALCEEQRDEGVSKVVRAEAVEAVDRQQVFVI